MKMKKIAKGFTLIEVMIVVAVIAILAAVALPSYFDYIRKSRRADGMDALLFIQTRQEKHRASNTTYAQSLTDATTATPPGLGLGANSEYYALVITADSATATGYTLTATAQGDQANDDEKGVSCATLVLTVNAGNPRGQKGRGGDATDDTCWGR